MDRGEGQEEESGSPTSGDEDVTSETMAVPGGGMSQRGRIADESSRRQDDAELLLTSSSLRR